MNQVLQPFLNKFEVYFDDIPIYSCICEDHLLHLNSVFSVLHDNHLVINLKKCSFLQPQINFLGFLISKDDIAVDPKKIEAINNWQQPKSVRDVQCFLGLASFYRKFIKNFSSIAEPLTNCLKKNNFIWGKEQIGSFNPLKKLLASSPVLALPDFHKPFEVNVDASALGIGAVLSQNKHPIEYFGEKLRSSRQKWSTYEQNCML